MMAWLQVRAGRQPQGISLAVGEEAPFFQRPGGLLVGQKVAVPGLAEAVNRALPGDGNPAAVALVLRAEVPGEMRIASFSAHTITVRRALDGHPLTARLSIPWGGPAVGRVEIGAGSELLAVGFSLTQALAGERLYLAPDSRPALAGHFCDLLRAPLARNPRGWAAAAEFRGAISCCTEF